MPGHVCEMETVDHLEIEVAVFAEMLENFPCLSVAFLLNELDHRHHHSGTSKHIERNEPNQPYMNYRTHLVSKITTENLSLLNLAIKKKHNCQRYHNFLTHVI